MFITEIKLKLKSHILGYRIPFRYYFWLTVFILWLHGFSTQRLQVRIPPKAVIFDFYIGFYFNIFSEISIKNFTFPQISSPYQFFFKRISSYLPIVAHCIWSFFIIIYKCMSMCLDVSWRISRCVLMLMQWEIMHHSSTVWWT